MNLHPGRVIVGRAVTCRWVPRRPDLHDSIDKQGQADQRVGFKNSWVIYELENNDLIVVDLFGKIYNCKFAGDNLAIVIKSRSGTGKEIDGGIRDTQRILEMDDFNAFVRGVDPSAILDVSMPEINGITRIGEATCVPGDVVLGTSTGVIFIPPHLALEVVERSEVIRLKDEFGQQRIREGV
jgi:regulator of RNase E activity RraA